MQRRSTLNLPRPAPTNGIVLEASAVPKFPSINPPTAGPTNSEVIKTPQMQTHASIDLPTPDRTNSKHLKAPEMHRQPSVYLPTLDSLIPNVMEPPEIIKSFPCNDQPITPKGIQYYYEAEIKKRYGKNFPKPGLTNDRLKASGIKKQISFDQSTLDLTNSKELKTPKMQTHASIDLPTPNRSNSKHFKAPQMRRQPSVYLPTLDSIIPNVMKPPEIKKLSRFDKPMTDPPKDMQNYEAEVTKRRAMNFPKPGLANDRLKASGIKKRTSFDQSTPDLTNSKELKTPKMQTHALIDLPTPDRSNSKHFKAPKMSRQPSVYLPTLDSLIPNVMKPPEIEKCPRYDKPITDPPKGMQYYKAEIKKRRAMNFPKPGLTNDRLKAPGIEKRTSFDQSTPDLTNSKGLKAPELKRLSVINVSTPEPTNGKELKAPAVQRRSLVNLPTLKRVKLKAPAMTSTSVNDLKPNYRPPADSSQKKLFDVIMSRMYKKMALDREKARILQNVPLGISSSDTVLSVPTDSSTSLSNSCLSLQDVYSGSTSILQEQEVSSCISFTGITRPIPAPLMQLLKGKIVIKPNFQAIQGTPLDVGYAGIDSFYELNESESQNMHSFSREGLHIIPSKNDERKNTRSKHVGNESHLPMLDIETLLEDSEEYVLLELTTKAETCEQELEDAKDQHLSILKNQIPEDVDLPNVTKIMSRTIIKEPNEDTRSVRGMPRSNYIGINTNIWPKYRVPMNAHNLAKKDDYYQNLSLRSNLLTNSSEESSLSSIEGTSSFLELSEVEITTHSSGDSTDQNGDTMSTDSKTSYASEPSLVKTYQSSLPENAIENKSSSLGVQGEKNIYPGHNVLKLPQPVHSSLESIDRFSSSLGSLCRCSSSLEAIDRSSSSLEELDCSSSSLEELDCSSSSLEELDCSSSSLEAIDCSSSSLEAIDCSSSSLISLFRSSFSLKAIDRSSSSLEAIDRSSSSLEAIDRSSSSLEAIDRSSSSLEAIDRSSSSLEAIDHSSSSLEELDCSSSSLESLCRSSSSLESLCRCSSSFESLNRSCSSLISLFSASSSLESLMNKSMLSLCSSKTSTENWFGRHSGRFFLDESKSDISIEDHLTEGRFLYKGAFRKLSLPGLNYPHYKEPKVKKLLHVSECDRLDAITEEEPLRFPSDSNIPPLDEYIKNQYDLLYGKPTLVTKDLDCCSLRGSCERIGLARMNKKQLEEYRQELLCNLPFYTEDDLEKLKRKSYHRYICRKLDEDCLFTASIFIEKLVQYDTDRRKNTMSGLCLGKELKDHKIHLERLGDGLRDAAAACDEGRYGFASEEFLRMAIVFMQNGDWWWLAERMFDVSVMFGEHIRDRLALPEAMARYIFGMFLYKNMKLLDEAEDHLRLAVKFSVGMSWRAKLLGDDQDTIFHESSSLLTQIYVERSAMALREDESAYRATSHATAALKLAEESDNMSSILMAVFQLVQCFEADNMDKEAIQLLKKYVLDCRDIGEYENMCLGYRELCDCLIRIDETKEAFEYMIRYKCLAKTHDKNIHRGEACLYLGRFHWGQEQLNEASAYFHEAYSIFFQLGMEEEIDIARFLCATIKGEQLMPHYGRLIRNSMSDPSCFESLLEWRHNNVPFWEEEESKPDVSGAHKIPATPVNPVDYSHLNYSKAHWFVTKYFKLQREDSSEIYGTYGSQTSFGSHGSSESSKSSSLGSSGSSGSSGSYGTSESL